MSKKTLKTFLWVSLIFVSTALSSYAQSPRGVSIQKYKYGGNGCPDGSVSVNLSPDAQAMTVLFDSFIVDSEGSRQYKTEKQCLLQLALKVPPGWAFSLFCVQYRGYGAVDLDVAGYHEAKYRMMSRNSSGRTPPFRSLGRELIKGPYEGDYTRLTQIPLRSSPWSSCSDGNQVVQLDTRVGIEKRPQDAGALGLMTVDSLDGELKQHYGIAWRKCRPSDQNRR